MEVNSGPEKIEMGLRQRETERERDSEVAYKKGIRFYPELYLRVGVSE